MDRLARKFESARGLLPAPVAVRDAGAKIGFLAYGSTDCALRESLDLIQQRYGLEADYMRLRAWPFAPAVHEFVAAHERVYVAEQNRDAQMASLLKLDLAGNESAKLRSILHYNGWPVDAESITAAFAAQEGL
jgi:2-oxoglutarate ferredoxin oxidoreductase subunit alpha